MEGYDSAAVLIADDARAGHAETLGRGGGEEQDGRMPISELHAHCVDVPAMLVLSFMSRDAATATWPAHGG